MRKEKNWYTIAVRESTKKELMLFKIQTKAANLDEVIKRAIKALKREVKYGIRF